MTRAHSIEGGVEQPGAHHPFPLQPREPNRTLRVRRPGRRAARPRGAPTTEFVTEGAFADPDGKGLDESALHLTKFTPGGGWGSA